MPLICTSRSSDSDFRKLNADVLRWDHKERLDESEPEGCGFPVCALVDSRPKRFVSLCALAGWMREQGLERRVLELQKGGCEDVSELANFDLVIVLPHLVHDAPACLRQSKG